MILKPVIATIVIAGLVPVSLPRWSQQVVEVEVESPRPLADALTEIEERLGAVVTYEDPILSYDGDLATIDLNGRPFRGPRGGLFRLRLQPPSTASNGHDVEHIVRVALADYAASGLAGTFRLDRTGHMLHVVPTAARDTGGILRPQVSILDTRISFDDRRRTALDVLEVLGNASGGRLAVGLRGNMNRVFEQVPLTGGATQEPMRSILAKVLDATDPTLSWRVYCGPAPDRTVCHLNLHAVRSLRLD
jgi:hypothetical protein